MNDIYFVTHIHFPMVTRPPALSPRRQRTRERRLEAIVAAALDLVGSEGLEALTMARVAAAVDLTPGALYRYFSSKDMLLATLHARTIERIGRLFEAQRTQWLAHLPGSRDGSAALCELIATAGFYLELAEQEPRAFRLVAGTLGDPRPLVRDEHTGLVATPLRELIVRVSQLFAAAASNGMLDKGSAPLRTIVLWTSLHGVLSAAKLDRLTDDDGWFAPARLAKELTTSLFVGWGADRKAVELAQAWQHQRLADHPTDWNTP